MGKEHLKASEPDDENPEWTEEDFARAKPVDTFPELARLVKPGRPAMAEAERKQRVTMYLDQDVIAVLKKDGRGWQTRANETLRKALGLAER
ncbi:BrnA antitoxin family protein [Marimonas sp. MJW-29]|uniref:BrnA antitoxin family protein n=1 Tax=Sulfitobacter sediminis TaxID=3234186 RepID=A0ABV3RIX9_9RHOB